MIPVNSYVMFYTRMMMEVILYLFLRRVVSYKELKIFPLNNLNMKLSRWNVTFNARENNNKKIYCFLNSPICFYPAMTIKLFTQMKLMDSHRTTFMNRPRLANLLNTQ
jgi:hypothetical protein